MPKAQLIDGQKLAEEILLKLKEQIPKLKKRPGLAAVLIGDNEASKMYLRLKEKACQKVGIDFHSYFLDPDCPEKKVLAVIDFLNKDQDIDGILVQLPLPKKFHTDKIIKEIKAKKDVDGFHPQTKIISPNILGIVELIKATGVKLKDKKVVILSNSKLFAKPFKKLLPQCKISYANPQSSISRLKAQTQKADILIVAVGKPKFIKPDMIKKDAILIDVGINKIPASAKVSAGKHDKTVGDIDPDCDKVAAFRSPVPGGVGPMTVAMLLQNLINLK